MALRMPLSLAMAPVVLSHLLDADVERGVRDHVREVRRLFDWPGIPYHDANAAPEARFYRWQVHNPPLLVQVHHRGDLVERVSHLVGMPLKPSYCFLSMYGPEGVCPEHRDRPQCAVTVDYLVSSDAQDNPWPLRIHQQDGWREYRLHPGDAVVYSGEEQAHCRDPMASHSDATYANLVFFHFVPVCFSGPLA